ncbi:HyaD/HybD family hydrogenase maturation endopeptidase [Campylobacter fetus]|uniref:Hydrogenase maturation protease n=3 Tax=Campylobacter fetus TaxID=196 RepID=A0A5L4LHY1_CAMFE|nr:MULTISPECIES: HyaD/HybD family hydrogenase maturation endopeptidase [Campylobacter]OCS23275.1 hydrogenase expression/formation protein [Campylobacter fetus subsp. venerealis cfvi97/532]OCS26811.1 hydrogenase expression/formation protein [Campylobacter fetus subsp. venerealis cfvB10]OCS30642.1 hydrogenase expression/formation protein [Campylobacter fetus subsp. venerealis LMG 6570 = CCUG 33900]OCS41299.1 hydrogenase expression/formation protein [Campylobacter fetus subsp. venerealis cfvi02/29
MRVLILGIGNVMFADEGIGVHFTKMIEKNFKFSSSKHSLDFVDGGTLANLLSPIIAKYDYVIVVDCIDADNGDIGDVYFFDFDDMPKSINWSGSAHEVEMLQTLEMMDLIGDRPQTKILGVIPKRIEPMSFELSNEVKASSCTMEKVILKHLKELGFDYEKVADFTVQTIADEWKKEQF